MLGAPHWSRVAVALTPAETMPGIKRPDVPPDSLFIHCWSQRKHASRMHDTDSTLPTVPTPATLRSHYEQVVLPIWRGPGFNTTLQLAFEAVAADGRTPSPPSRYRAMACARQLFVFSRAGDKVHADLLFDSLRHYFQDKQNGGWFYSVDANGAPKERQKDLYTHAFVVFACAEYARRSHRADALAVLHETSALIETRFAGRDGSVAGASLNAVMSEDFATVIGTPLQNPLMHLTEAWLAALDTTGDAVFDRRLETLAAGIAHDFVHQATGCIAEMPIGSAGNLLEPGHQFEWLFLVEASGHEAFDASGLTRAMSSAFDFAQRFGVDPLTGGVAAALDENGRIVDSGQRIWAQTEYLRALATHGDEAARERLPRQIELFAARFLTPRGWIECRSAEGAITRAEMPSTTPYHLATAYAGLPSG
jgi:mannose/cellobiose epimerase-like protein (N-acyl-D-glucosamine 2-epimerase family)